MFSIKPTLAPEREKSKLRCTWPDFLLTIPKNIWEAKVYCPPVRPLGWPTFVVPQKKMTPGEKWLNRNEGDRGSPLAPAVGRGRGRVGALPGSPRLRQPRALGRMRSPERAGLTSPAARPPALRCRPPCAVRRGRAWAGQRSRAPAGSGGQSRDAGCSARFLAASEATSPPPAARLARPSSGRCARRSREVGRPCCPPAPVGAAVLPESPAAPGGGGGGSGNTPWTLPAPPSPPARSAGGGAVAAPSAAGCSASAPGDTL